MGRTRVRRRRIVAAAVLVLGLWLAVPAAASALQANDRPVDVPAARYVVRQGDTLWAIAARTAEGRDPREVVDAIGEANELQGGAIVPGQTLVLPAG